MLLAAGCGRKLPPQPILQITPGAVRAWQREGSAIVAWPLPSPAEAAHLGGLEGFQLRIARVPARCLACPPSETRELELEMGAGGWRVEERWGFHSFPLPERPSLWRFSVATVYGHGATTHSPIVVLEAPARIPAHALDWEWVEQNEKAPAVRRVRLFWEARRERIVRIIKKEGGMVESERFFRVNLYRRRPRRRWPMRALNARPLEVRQVVLALPPAEGRSRQVWQFTLRLVDQFGNEGPAASAVTLRYRGGRP